MVGFTDYSPQTVFLIGAARSGTKLIRDLVSLNTSVDKIPYDINYVWRLENEKLSHDELSIQDLTPKILSRIRYKINKYGHGSSILIEKTVSNCLRVRFIRAVFPKARFIHLVRNGWDVVESAYRQWTASPDWIYIIGKTVRYPLFEAFDYARNYAHTTLGRLIYRNAGKVGTWGPKYRGIEQDLKTKELIEVCAIQWARSVECALRDLEEIPANEVMTIRYEDFVNSPRHNLIRIAEFLEIEASCYEVLQELSQVTKNNIGKGLSSLTDQQVRLVRPHIEKTMKLIGYL